MEVSGKIIVHVSKVVSFKERQLKVGQMKVLSRSISLLVFITFCGLIHAEDQQQQQDVANFQGLVDKGINPQDAVKQAADASDGRLTEGAYKEIIPAFKGGSDNTVVNNVANATAGLTRLRDRADGAPGGLSDDKFTNDPPKASLRGTDDRLGPILSIVSSIAPLNGGPPVPLFPAASPVIPSNTPPEHASGASK
jgi:hypothetical protein